MNLKAIDLQRESGYDLIRWSDGGHDFFPFPIPRFDRDGDS